MEDLPLLGYLHLPGGRQLHFSAPLATSPTLPFLANADPKIQLQYEWVRGIQGRHLAMNTRHVIQSLHIVYILQMTQDSKEGGI